MVDQLNDENIDSEYQTATYLQKESVYPIPDQLLGKPPHGLRLALVPKIEKTPTQLTVGAGDSVQIELVVENVSDNVIKLTGYTSQEAGRRVVVKASTGEDAEID